MASFLNLSPLLEAVMPQLPAGPARLALVRHLVELVSASSPASPSPSPSKVAAWEREVRRQINVLSSPSGSAKEELNSWSDLHAQILARWPMWDAGCAWGWHALGQVMEKGGSGTKVLELLAQPGAPGALDLTRRCLPSPASNTPPVALTLLGWLLSSSERSHQVLEKVLDLGVDLNAPCSSDGRFPLALAFDPDHIAVLRAHAARLGDKPVVWLPPVASKSNQTSAGLVSAQLSQWNALVGEGDKEFATQVVAFLPELTHQFARFLVSQPVDIRPFRALGRKAGVDVARPGPQDPSLRGEFARALLEGAVESCSPTKSPIAFLEGRLRPDEQVPEPQAVPGPWQGRAGEIDASVWGWLEALSRPNRSTAPTLWAESPSVAWWEEVGSALEKLQSPHACRPHAPLAWRLLAQMAPHALVDSQSHAAASWRAWSGKELARVVAAQVDDSHSPLGRPGSPVRPPANSPAQLWQGPVGSAAWKEWSLLLARMTSDFLAHPLQHPESTATLLLQAHVLAGLKSIPWALIHRHRSELDVTAIHTARATGLSRSRSTSPTPQTNEFWLELSMPAASFSPPRPRF